MFLHPSFEIKIESSKIKSGLSDTSISLLVDMTMDSYAGHAEIVLRIKEDNKIQFKKNSKITISIGYDKNLIPIFSGKINSLSMDLSQITIIALNSIYSLCNLRIDRFYENQTAGDIVKDLAKEAGVKVDDDVSNGFKFPYYAIDSNKNAFEHIKELAILCGFDVYCTNEDKLVFKKYEPTTKHKIIYGENIINLKKLDPTTVYNSLSILGDSPSSSKGTDTSHWLTKKQIKGFAESVLKKDGGGGETRKRLVLTKRFVKDEDTATKIAAESLKKLNSKMLLQIEIVGNQAISLGDSIFIEKLPIKELNGEYRINSIEHFISKYTGYLTTLQCQGA